MKFYKILFFVILFFGFFTKSFSQYIQVDDTYTAQQLVQNVLVNSPCASVSNFSVSGDPFSPGEQSFGYFTAGTSSFPFIDGIVLSTSRAKRTEGPNNNLIDEGLTSWLGDNDLEQAIGISGTFNSTILEFDFVPLTSTISFDYLFASEEYQGNAPCKYSDAFAFLLREANTTNAYQNLAIIPNTNLPVLVTNVHPYIGGNNGCDAINEAYFDRYNSSSAPINLNGQTKVLTAFANVTPETTYHIKLVIADHENIRYDSAIFLSGGSFKIGANLGIDKLIATNNPLCTNEIFQLNATVTGAISYKWYKNGTQLLDTVTGLPITTPTYQVSSAGTYKVEVVINSSCTATDEIVIEYAAPIAASTVTLLQCDDDNDGFSTFNLTKSVDLIASNLTIENYYLTQVDAENETNKILSSTNFSNSVANQVVIRVKNEFGCIGFVTLQLQIANNVVNSITKEYCDDDGNQDGLTQFTIQDFDAISLEILTTLPSGYSLSYHTNIQDAVLQTNAISLPFSNTIAFQQTLYARVINGVDCYGIIPVNLIVNTFLPLNFEDKSIGICSGVPQIIGVDAGFSSYSWNTTLPQTSNQISVTEPGTYIVEVTNSKNCKATKTFFVTASESAIIGSISIDDFNGQNNSVLINYTGIGDYEFSLDGIHFQDSNFFNNLNQGEYTVYIKDKKGCDTVTSDFLILTYPTFFTPNDDGYNDTWKIKNIDIYPNSKLEIFDRYGKLLKNLSANDSGWNGKFSNKNLPADDYWFILTLSNKKEIKGHFSLKR